MGGGRADAAQLERLEQALNQRDGEIQVLNCQIAKLQKNQVNQIQKTLRKKDCTISKTDTSFKLLKAGASCYAKIVKKRVFR